MNKRDYILDALETLFEEGKGGTASVSEIAKKAGIAKGGMYYYFRSKEELLDALVERQYEHVIQSCSKYVDELQTDAITKFALLLKKYREMTDNIVFDECLHLLENAAIHQKSLAKILNSLSNVVAKIIQQGIEEKLFKCSYPLQYAHIILSVFTFLLDKGIFEWTLEEQVLEMKALASLLERGLQAPEQSFIFLYKLT